MLKPEEVTQKCLDFEKSCDGKSTLSNFDFETKQHLIRAGKVIPRLIYKFDNGIEWIGFIDNKNRFVTRNMVPNGTYDSLVELTLSKPKTPQDIWQEKAGYVSKSYKLKKEVVDNFRDACEKADRTQADVLTGFMEEFISLYKEG